MTTAEVDTLPADAARTLDTFADLLDVLIRLHDREADDELLDGLRSADVTGWFDDFLSNRAGRQAARDLRTALQDLPSRLTPAARDDLAAEFADVYLTHGYRIAPSGSVWLTEDHLERQMPMFDVRDWYAHYDITVPDWRIRADDHLVHELQFLSFLLRRGSLVSASDAARFMDLHVLSWMPEFLSTGRPRLRHKLYRAVFDLTGALLEDLRDRLRNITGIEREIRPGKAATPTRMPEDDAYMPGVSESW